MNDPDLHERLDKALGAIEPIPAPIEETVRKGNRIRWRRRTVAVTASLATVAAAAIVVPLATHTLASPAPATTRYTVTVRQPGPGSPANEIAVGTVNGKSWRILMSKSAGSLKSGYTTCAQGLGPAFDVEELDGPGPCEPPYGATAEDPVTWNGMQSITPNSVAAGYAGEVAANVSYVTVTFTNGTVLTLQPVTVYGNRYVAFATPANAVARVTAYSALGEIATSVAFAPTGQGIFMSNAWLRPGQRGLPLVTGTIGSGTIDGKAWSATAYQGPWGICVGLGNEVGTCAPVTAPVPLGCFYCGVTGKRSGPPSVAVWAVPPSTTHVVVKEHDKKAFQVRPVTIGVQKFVTFLVPAGLWEPTVTAYDKTGHVIGSR